MALPRLLMRLVDPANVYFVDHSPGRVERPAYGTGVFGPGGSREATPEEAAAIRRRAEDLAAQDEPGTERRFSQEDLSEAASELLEIGHATIGEPPDAVRVRIVRFWRGDSILEVDQRQGRGLHRIPRELRPESRADIAARLATALRDQ